MGHFSITRTILYNIKVVSVKRTSPVNDNVAYFASISRLHIVDAQDLRDLMVFNQLVADPLERVL